MALFTPCRGKAYCSETTEGCRTCGRSHHEIEATRSLIAQAAQVILEQDYDNAREFASYLAEKVAKKVTYARERSESAAID